jgi:hypothetical protein
MRRIGAYTKLLQQHSAPPISWTDAMDTLGGRRLLLLLLLPLPLLNPIRMVQL